MLSRPLIRQIRRYPNDTTVLSVGKLFPDDWVIVRIEVKEKGIDTLTVQFKKLNGALAKALQELTADVQMA